MDGTLRSFLSENSPGSGFGNEHQKRIWYGERLTHRSTYAVPGFFNRRSS